MSHKVLIFSDVHWSKTSSVFNKRGAKYTVRLEHLIDSMNWVNNIAKEKNCDFMICAGDMMDQSACDDEEITATREIIWNDLDCYFLCGNHESSVNDLSFSTVKLFENSKHHIIDNVSSIIPEGTNTQIHFIPYIVESDRAELKTYLTDADKTKKQVIISHNDIAGIQYGGFLSKLGFSIDEIEANTDLYLNGHLHNSEFITSKILNVGSLSAHNFTNDSFNYKYGIWILDLDTLALEFIENPYAFNFYKLEINDTTQLAMLKTLKNNAAITVKCLDTMEKDIKAAIQENKNIIYHRLIVKKLLVSTEEIEANISSLTVDHITKFTELALEKLDNTEVLMEELSIICA